MACDDDVFLCAVKHEGAANSSSYANDFAVEFKEHLAALYGPHHDASILEIGH